MASLLEMSAFAICLALCLVFAAAAPPSGKDKKDQDKKVGLYNEKYDNVNLDQILNNERLLKAYFECLMDRGHCTPDGEELRTKIPDALDNGCAKCTEKQKQGTEKVFKFLIKEKPELFTEFEKKYDPQGSYRKQYRKDAEAHGVKV